ncbi:MAG: hypothetical protein GX275_04755 [Clostridiales bacterium]|nr:hypothetical protein [Clostridiales bacterium]
MVILESPRTFPLPSISESPRTSPLFVLSSAIGLSVSVLSVLSVSSEDSFSTKYTISSVEDWTSPFPPLPAVPPSLVTSNLMIVIMIVIF